jgi:rubrerythrin
MKELKGTKTHDNLKQRSPARARPTAATSTSRALADIEGYPEIGGLFRDTSEAETGHAFGHMDF